MASAQQSRITATALARPAVAVTLDPASPALEAAAKSMSAQQTQAQSRPQTQFASRPQTNPQPQSQSQPQPQPASLPLIITTTTTITTSLQQTPSSAAQSSPPGAPSGQPTTRTKQPLFRDRYSTRYEELTAGKPPIPVTIAPPRSTPSALPIGTAQHGRRLNAQIPEPRKRDSGLASAGSVAASAKSVRATPIWEESRDKSGIGTYGDKRGGMEGLDDDAKVEIARPATAVPAAVDGDRKASTSTRAASYTGPAKLPAKLRKANPRFTSDAVTPVTPDSAVRSESTVSTGELADKFSPLTTPIPIEPMLEFDFMDKVTFSKRGSVMLGGQKAIELTRTYNDTQNATDSGTSPSKMKIADESTSTSKLTTDKEGPEDIVVNSFRRGTRTRGPSLSMQATTDASKALSAELELESQKVRSMYETGTALDWKQGAPTAGEASNGTISSGSANPVQPLAQLRVPDMHSMQPEAADPKRPLSAASDRRPHEVAGGLEDWENLGAGDVDRYGFIVSKLDAIPRSGTPEPRGPQRTSTVLQQASEAPRRNRGFGRQLSTATSSRANLVRTPSRKPSSKSLYTQGTSKSLTNSPRKSLRAARNRLPGNADRRWLDEAGDMLTLPPGLAAIAEHEEGGRAVEAQKAREVRRTEKWRKMAKVVHVGKPGAGNTVYEFDTRSTKLIERVWKGIPDAWRTAAWFSFLKTSARRMPGSATDEQIITAYRDLVLRSSADDVQIDMDVPRTISSHIMFRRRYRGGQRLLFRVLHSLSLYLPQTGYVQGMASLGATLLCYFEEEQCFIMLVRIFTLRGLDTLYSPGFAGLFAALDEFKTGWMSSSAVARKLAEYEIEPTAYGTRWYLTLFNYSIPFAAQLRVWDVFMLLGDVDPSVAATKKRPFRGGLDVLHAASAALVDGTREILLDSDFEGCMRVLTSWVPIRDEELFMRVAKAEWKARRCRRS